MTCHLITNVVVRDVPDSDEVVARSAFAVRQARKLRDEAWWTGRRIDRLRRVDGSWKLVRREVLLDSTILPRGISIFF
jgi:3-phenylpropionate/cinnamic acid dioxygenase small subunit